MAVIGAEEWIKQAGRAAAARTVPGLSVTISTSIEKSPAGKVAWTETFDGSDVTVEAGATKGADVVLTAKFVDFVRLLDGEVTAAAHFMQGRLKMSGDMSRWLEMLPVWDSESATSARKTLGEATDRT